MGSGDAVLFDGTRVGDTGGSCLGSGGGGDCVLTRMHQHIFRWPNNRVYSGQVAKGEIRHTHFPWVDLWNLNSMVSFSSRLMLPPTPRFILRATRTTCLSLLVRQTGACKLIVVSGWIVRCWGHSQRHGWLPRMYKLILFQRRLYKADNNERGLSMYTK